jgi:hypothetical protein
VPNQDKIHYDYEEDRPTPYTWKLRRRKGEKSLSLFREGNGPQCVSLDDLEALKPNFAVYRVQAETLLLLGATQIIYEPNDYPLGAAHFGVYGWDDDKAERIAVDRKLTEQAKPPGAHQDNPF